MRAAVSSGRSLLAISEPTKEERPGSAAEGAASIGAEPNGIPQTVGLAALSDLPYMRGNVLKIRATRARLTAELRRRGWRVCDSQTNFLFASPPDGDAGKVFEALKASKIFVRYFPGPATGEHLRITIGTDAQTDALLARL